MKRALVVGNSAGIGLAVTRALLDKGYAVAGISRRAAPIDHAYYVHHVQDVSGAAYRDLLSGIMARDPELSVCIYCVGIGDPLRLDNRLSAIHLCEYGAQAMAVHGGLKAQSEGKTAKPGFLVSLRDVVLHIDFVDQLSGDLNVRAECLLETPASWQYAFTIEHASSVLATGRAAVVARA